MPLYRVVSGFVPYTGATTNVNIQPWNLTAVNFHGQGIDTDIGGSGIVLIGDIFGLHNGYFLRLGPDGAFTDNVAGGNTYNDGLGAMTINGLFTAPGANIGADGGDVYVGSSAGRLRFYSSSAPIAKPSGDVATALSALNLISSPTINTLSINNPLMAQVFS